MTFVLSAISSFSLVMWLQPNPWGGFAIGVLSYMFCSVWRVFWGVR